MEECFHFIRKNDVHHQTIYRMDMIDSLEKGEKPNVTGFGMFWDEDYGLQLSEKAIDAKNKLQEQLYQSKYRSGGAKYCEMKKDFESLTK